MLALAITLSIIILLALLRFGIILEYSDEGFHYWGKVGFLKFRIDKDKSKKRKKKVKEKVKPKNINKQILPGSLSEFMDMLRAVKNLLDRLRRKLLIKKLTLHYVSAGEDPANIALQFGAAHAVFNTIIPLLEGYFRIRRKDLNASADFNAKEQSIYAKINISIALWELIYVISALFPVIAGIFKRTPERKITGQESKERKDGQNHGKSPDKRPDGKNDGKNEGND